MAVTDEDAGGATAEPVSGAGDEDTGHGSILPPKWARTGRRGRAMDRRSDRAATTLLLAPGPVPSGQSIGLDDGKPGRKPGLVSSDADQAGEFAELFRAVYPPFH